MMYFKEMHTIVVKKTIKKSSKTMVNPKFSRVDTSSWDRGQLKLRRGLQRASDVLVTYYSR